jgi:putative hydrolase of HD superfamily
VSEASGEEAAVARLTVTITAMTDARTIIDVLQALDPLTSLRRTGYVIRGVAEAETIAAHSFGVALVAMFFVDELRSEGADVDGERVLRMALLHDAPEAMTGDVPMPFKTPGLEQALYDVEAKITTEELPPEYAELWREAERGESMEARIVKAADKVQLMIKVLTYEQQRQGDLDDFWANAKNFRDAGLAVAREVYAEVCRRAGRDWPQ